MPLAAATPTTLVHRTPQQVGPEGVASSLLGSAIGGFALEVAARLEPIGVVLGRYGLTGDQYRALLRQPAFRQTVKEAAVQFAALSGTGERIKIKAQLLTEMSLEEMWSIIGDSKQSASARVAAFAAIKSLTGLEKPEPAPTTQKFNLTIALPPNMASTEVVNVRPMVIEGEVSE